MLAKHSTSAKVGKEREFERLETFFRENDSSSTAWPIPNILAVRPRAHRLDKQTGH